jgi:hypothetical protein
MSNTLTLEEVSEIHAEFRDHKIFCRECLPIRDLGGSKVPLILSPGQLKEHRAIGEMRLAGKPVRLVILKPRRTYFTVGSCAEMFHEVPFYPGRRGLIIADKYKPAALEAFDYLLQFQRGYKPFTRGGTRLQLPQLVKDTEQELRWENESTFEVLSADGGEIRGGGRHFVLLDEVAFWRNASVTLTGVLNMVPYLPETMVIVQSTANGIGGEFYELAQKAQDPANDSGWKFLFFSWLEHPFYQLPLNEGERSKLQRTLTRDEAQLQEMHHATLEQLAWRRKTIATECRGNLDIFNQEFPATAQDAFLAGGRPAFDHKALSRHPVAQGTSGELKVIEEPPVRRLRFQPQDRGALTIWRNPKAGHRYVIGADPSKGVDVSGDGRGSNPDYSVGFVIDQDTGQQVAQLRDRIRPGAFADYLALLGRWYNWAYLVPESNDAGFIDALLRTEYPQQQIYSRQRDPTDRRPARMQDIGFETTVQTREWLVSAADETIRNLGITIMSPVALQECRTFVIKPNGKKEHQAGCHDDCVLALALATIGLRSAPKQPYVEAPPKRHRVQFYGRAKRRDEDDDDDDDHHETRSFG